MVFSFFFFFLHVLAFSMLETVQRIQNYGQREGEVFQFCVTPISEMCCAVYYKHGLSLALAVHMEFVILLMFDRVP